MIRIDEWLLYLSLKQIGNGREIATLEPLTARMVEMQAQFFHDFLVMLVTGSPMGRLQLGLMDEPRRVHCSCDARGGAE